MPSQPEDEQQPENTSEIVFFGSWQVTDYRASRIYALSQEEIEEQFNIDMTGWWNESDTIAYTGIISAESDESPSLRYCFGTEFFVIDSDTI